MVTGYAVNRTMDYKVSSLVEESITAKIEKG